MTDRSSRPPLARRIVRGFRSRGARFLREGWLGGVVVGVRLGLASRERLHAGDEAYYSGGKDDGHTDYAGDEQNRRGLAEWETRVVSRFFPPRGRLLVMAAGGGREVLALARMGYEVDGYEPHPGLVAFARGFLAREGAAGGRVEPIGRDRAPEGGGPYDGVIVGWSAYTLIQGRATRVRFLRELRKLARPGAPLVVSFFYRDGSPFRHALIARLGTLLRRARGDEPVEEGDALAPNYVHLFHEDEVRAELREGGWEPVFYDTFTTGHAVGVAAGPGGVP